MMLYHTESKDNALSEIKRVLKNNGRAGIITAGDENMKQLFKIAPHNMSDSFKESIADVLMEKYFPKVFVEKR